MKKVLSLVLVLAMVLGSFSFVLAAPLSDIAGTVYEEAGTRLELLEILKGYPDGTFKPENQITRAEFAAVAIRAKGLESTAQAAKGLATGFSDVPASNWASGYVGTAAKLGIVNGVGNGQFAPDAPVKYEEAITMLVRALGYEEAAKQKGGYPYGYLIVANENGLLDAVKGGTQGAPATRGTVAQLVDNALEIPLMIQVGYGTNTKWVVSGSKEHGDEAEERYLLDDMGFESVKGRVISVTPKTNKLTVEQDKKNVTLKVTEGFDFYAVEGLETKFWYKNDTVVVHKVKEEAKFDAVEVAKDKLKLVTENEKYDVAKKPILTLNDKSVDQDEFNADYAKIVLNDDDEIIWAQGYTFDGFILVDEVKDNEIIGYGDDELKVKDFTIVKEGKTIAAEDLEDGEIVFYNLDKEFAVVATSSKDGKIERVYSDGFRLDGKAYNFTTLADVKYFDGKNLVELDTDLLDEIEEDGDEVTIFFSFANKVVVVSGKDKDVDASSFYAVLTDGVGFTTGRRGQNYVSIDVRTADNSKKSYDLSYDVFNDSKLFNVGVTENQFNAVKNVDALLGLLNLNASSQKFEDENDVIKVTVDKDGDVTKIAVPENDKIKTAFKVSASYAKGDNGDYRLNASTVVFYDGNKKAIKIGDIKDEFEEIRNTDTGRIYYESGKAVAIVSETNADADTKTVTGKVERIGSLSNGAVELRVKVAGKTETYVADNKASDKNDAIVKNQIVKLTIGEKSGKIVDLTENVTINDVTYKKGELNVVVPKHEKVTIEEVSNRNLTDTAKKKYELVTGYKIYDKNDDYAEVTTTRELKGREVVLYFVGNSNVDVNYAIVDGVVKGGDVTKGVVTYKDATNKAVYVDNTPYVLGASTILKTAKGSIIAVGDSAILTALATNDEVADIVVKDGVVTSLVATKIASVQTAAVTAVINTLNSNELNPAHADFNKNGNDVTNARTAYDALTPAQRDFVTNYDKLVVAEKAIASADAANVAADKAALTVTYNGEAATIALAGTGAKGSTISWVSDKTAVIASGSTGNVTVNRPTYTDGNATVTLTATIKSGDVEDTKVFTVTVKAAAPTDAEKMAADKAALTIAGDLNNVTANLTLAGTGENGSTITWTSSHPTIVATDGTVTRPAGANVQVTLTASIIAGSETTPITKVFYVTVLGE